MIVQHFYKQINENQYWHRNLLLYLNDGSTLMDNILWLRSQHMDVVMKLLYETKLQHQGYEFHQYLYIMERNFKKKPSNAFI